MADLIPPRKAAPPAPPAAPVQAKHKPIRLTHPYAYYDEDDRLHHWAAGHIVHDPHEIADLQSRKAPHEVIE